jgi:hypothetical protein
MGPSVHGHDLSADEQRANARLAAAAFDVAEKAKEMGYDPVAAVQALPHLLSSMERMLGDVKSNDPAEPSAQRPTGGAIKSMEGALARAEGSRDE